MYLGSADWMRRNLYRRVECVFPVNDEALKSEILDILNIQLADTQSARLIGKDGENIKIDSKFNKLRAQVEIYKYLEEKYNANYENDI